MVETTGHRSPTLSVIPAYQVSLLVGSVLALGPGLRARVPVLVRAILRDGPALLGLVEHSPPFLVSILARVILPVHCPVPVHCGPIRVLQ